MNLKYRSIILILIVLFSVNKSNSQERMDQFHNLIFIENIPKSSDISSIEIKINPLNSSVKLNESGFLEALDNNPRSIKPGDKILLEWQYSPWGVISFLTSTGKYEIELNLGGLGIMTQPNGKRGVVLFDFSKHEKYHVDQCIKRTHSRK